MVSESDATPAYRGYRRQALYSLWRLLADSRKVDPLLVFQPEGQEDLAIYDSTGELLEVVQVKAYSSSLTLSSFSPDKRDSFFYRVATLAAGTPGLKVTIASFGAIGTELRQALSGEGRERKATAQKLANYNCISVADAESLLAQIGFSLVEETELEEQVFGLLSTTLLGVDPETAFDLLLYWLYNCAENKRRITRQDVIDKVNRVGKFLSERAAHQSEWFTSIVPFEAHTLSSQKKVELSDEFYRGISAQYDHVLADVDVRRPAKMREVAEKFASERIVIIHGASGQGKSTLAYRYLHENIPACWRFQVRLIASREHALRIARALAGHADAMGVPILVYVDVSPSDTDWPELIRGLAAHRNIRVLVTIREEDWRRASISGTEVSLSGLDLQLDRSEAQEIYNSLVIRRTPANLLRFEDAWSVFGGEGPLMEFVHLVTQGESLRQRLSKQLERLEEEVRTGLLRENELELLRIVAVASAFGARLRVGPLAGHLGLSAPKRTFELLEKEYLLRRSESGDVVSGLHPLRSAMITEILTDPTLSPWSDSATTCLPFISSEDVETFLLYAFSRRQTETNPLLEVLETYQPDQWLAIAGITRALLWLGVLEYTQSNVTLVQEVFEQFGPSGVFMLDYDIGDAMAGTATPLWEIIGDHVPADRRQLLQELQDRQTRKEDVFTRARGWLAGRTVKPDEPASDADWSGTSEVMFWLGHLGVSWPLAHWLTADSLNRAMDLLPIDILSDLVLGLKSVDADALNHWLSVHRSDLLKRFKRDTHTLVLQDTGPTVTAHFLVGLQEQVQPLPTRTLAITTDRDTSNYLHD